MANSLKYLIALFLFLSSPVIFAQQNKILDSFKLELRKANTLEEQVTLMDIISRTLMNDNVEEAEKYGKELIQLAEKSRDRTQMVRAYISNGLRCAGVAGAKDFTARAMEYYDKAKKIAAENKLYSYEISVLLKQAQLQLLIPDKDKAAAYVDKAVSISSNIKDDSVQVQIKLSSGNIHIAKNEKIEALRSYLSALRLAEKIKNILLQRNSYLKLSDFYSSIEDYDKAIDYFTLAIKKLDESKVANKIYQKVVDINSVGGLYAQKKDYGLALSHYEEALKLADSLNYEPIKINIYLSLLNVYIDMKEPHKSMEFIESEAGTKVKKFFANFGMTPMIDQAYAIIFSEMGQLDSARIYFDRSAPFYENNPNLSMQMYSFMNQGTYFKRKGEYQKAINLLLKVNELAEKTGHLEASMDVNKNLDTLYSKIGNYEQSKFYAAQYYLYKDSIQTINKEKELTQVEAQDEQARQLKIEEEAAEKKRQRNNIQYLAITIGIVTLFLLMVIFGMFRVSAGTIKMIGFFAFLMFFEFIFLIFKKNIYAFTHGEPWMDLLFMIGLAAILLPLHHWLEHKVLHYLTSTNKLTTAGSALRSRFSRKFNQVTNNGK